MKSLSIQTLSMFFLSIYFTFFFFNTEEKMKVLEWKALSGAASFQSCSVVVVGGDVCICSLVFCDLRTMDSP